MKRRILFVDDEQRILEGLRTRLRRKREVWEMSFVESGAAALALMEQQPIDVLVTDMRMPGMDGAALLREVLKRHPQVVRIVLSGHAELETALRAVPVAHQFLSKPSDVGVIEAVVERACALQAVVSDEAVRAMIGRIEQLPALPRVYSRLLSLLEDDRTGAAEVAELLKQDMALAAKLLQMVNSAFFRLSRAIATIEEAVTYLGFTTLRQVTLAVEVFGAGGPEARRLEELQAHALLVGSIAADLFAERQRREDAFVAGLLHDLGKLIVTLELPAYLESVSAALAVQPSAMHLVERELFGVTHAELGGYLLGIWGLPYPVVEAVANHHAPERVASRELDLLTAVHVSDVLAHELAPARLGAVPVLDEAHLSRLGLLAELPRWRELACARAMGTG